MARRLVLALLALVACGDNLPDTGQAYSGERIKLGYYEYADGTRQRDLDAYYDRERDEPCRPVQWSDGARYCTPAYDEAVYADERCATAVGRVAAGAVPAPYFARMYSVHGTAYPSRLHVAGALTPPPPLRWELLDGTCYGPLLNDGAFDYYELGAQVLEPARIKRALPRGEGRLARLDDYSDDGLRAPIAIYDQQAGDCGTVGLANADSEECVPADVALAPYYHDGTCTEPVLAIATATIPSLASEYTIETRCWTYRQVQRELMAPQLFERIGGGCTEVPTPDGQRFFTTGPPVALPRVTREREATTRRLRRITRVADDLRLADPLVYDSELAADCTHVVIGSELRCAPVTAASVEPFFSDVGCQTSIDLALVPAGACDPPTMYARRGEQIVPLVAPYTAPIYVLSTGDTCGLFAPPVPYVPYSVGPPLAPDRFVTAALQIDP